MKNSRRPSRNVLAAILFCMLSAGVAQADAIVDTGPVSVGPGAPNWTLNYSQWLGSRFTVDGSTTISGVEGFFGCNSGGTLLAVLHADGGTIPGAQLFSQAFSVTAGAGDVSWNTGGLYPYTYHYGWFGADALSWNVAPGSYWITFETPASGSRYDGVMPGGARNPLALDAHTNWTPWFPGPGYEQLCLGIRVDGEGGKHAPVPEPGMLMLLGSGIVGLAGFGRSRIGRNR